MAKATKKGGVKMLTADSALRVVELDVIQFDPSYQRGEVAGHKKIVAEFNEKALGIPLVGQRADGSLWGVDGRQRITALRKLGWKKVRAEVFLSDGPEHEALIFKLVNGGRTKLSPAELFKARLVSHDPVAWDIKRAVEAAGFQLAFSRNNTTATAWKYVMAFTTLERVYRMGKRNQPNAERITRVLNTVKAAWPDDPACANSDIIGGIGRFYLNRGDEMVDDDRLVQKLGTTTPVKLIYSAGLGVGGRHENVAEVVAKLYAKRGAKKKVSGK